MAEIIPGITCRKRLQAMIVWLAAVSGSCSLLPPVSTIADCLPRETDVPGWVQTGQYRVGNPKKIGQLNPLYAEYDPVESVAAEYCRVADENKVVRVEIIKFRSSLDAFGIYSREHGLDTAGNAYLDSEYAVNRFSFLRLGNFYVKIAVEKLEEQERDAVPQFLAVVRNNIKKRAVDGPLPEAATLLMKGASGIVYYKKGVASIPGLMNIFVVRRTIAGKRLDIACSEHDSPFGAEQEFNKLLNASGGAFILSRFGPHQVAVRIVSDTEHVVISRYKQWIFGVLNADTMKEGNSILFFLLGEIKNATNNK